MFEGFEMTLTSADEIERVKRLADHLRCIADILTRYPGDCHMVGDKLQWLGMTIEAWQATPWYVAWKRADIYRRHWLSSTTLSET